MRKLVMILVMAMVAFGASAEALRLNVKYNDEWGSPETTTVEVSLDNKVDAAYCLKHLEDNNIEYGIELVDDDSSNKDKAIVAKLEKCNREVGYCRSMDKTYLKMGGSWFIIYQ